MDIEGENEASESKSKVNQKKRAKVEDHQEKVNNPPFTVFIVVLEIDVARHLQAFLSNTR